jgi:hypothetical protein
VEVMNQLCLILRLAFAFEFRVCRAFWPIKARQRFKTKLRRFGL